MARKTNAQLQAEIQALRRSYWTEALSANCLQLIKWGCLGWIFWCIRLSIGDLAGRETMANIGVSVLGHLRLSDAFAILFGGGGTAYGVYQRKLRRDQIEQDHPRIERMEEREDPKRSTSGLDRRGRTRPEDQR